MGERDYRSEHERRSEESREFHRLRMLATTRARQRLSEMYPKAYRRLLREERKTLGVPLGSNARTVVGPAHIDGSEGGLAGRMTSYEDLVAAIDAIHKPRKEEVERWPDDGFEPPVVIECLVQVEVCEECGHEYDGDYPVFRPWPCPTWRAAHNDGSTARERAYRRW